MPLVDLLIYNARIHTRYIEIDHYDIDVIITTLIQLGNIAINFTFLNIFIFSSTLVLTFSYRRNLYTFYQNTIIFNFFKCHFETTQWMDNNISNI